MSFFNSLLVSSLLLGFSANKDTYPLSEDCPSIEVNYRVEQPQINRFTISVNPKGGKAPYIVMLTDESGQVATEDYTKSKFENLKKGTYTCIVLDKARCVKKTEILIP